MEKKPHILVLLNAGLLFVAAGWAFAQPGTGTIRVDGATGVDGPACGAAASPCQTIQKAVNLASGGGTILVAAGTYVYDAALDTVCTPSFGQTGVVCVINKSLTILGGYGGGNWSTRNSAANLTVIDGQNQKRGVFVQSVAFETTFRMEGFTVTRGFAQGASSGLDIDTFAWGGGFNSTLAHVVLRDMVFLDNAIQGGNKATGYGGAGSGGGAAIRGNDSRQLTALLERIRFVSNEARGGTGPDRGGLALGGGLYVKNTDLQANDLTVTDNLAIAGNSAGSGTGGGYDADALGGGVSIQVGSDAVFDRIVATGNEARGGAAGTSAGNRGGTANGGGFFVELASLTLRDADVRSNLALGGSGNVGGGAAGGGVASTSAPAVTLGRVVLIENQATGGNGTTSSGSPGGGGATFHASTVTVDNSLVADNVIGLGSGANLGGGGGGFFLTGAAQLSVSHSTFAANRFASTPLGGGAIILVGSGCVANLDYTTISDHTSVGSASALRVQSGSTANLDLGLFANNTSDTKVDAGGTLNGLGTMLSVASVDFASPGSPDYDYHLTASSPAVDGATTSAETVDFEGQARLDTPDIGHDELGPAALIFTDGFESGNVFRWPNWLAYAGGP